MNDQIPHCESPTTHEEECPTKSHGILLATKELVSIPGSCRACVAQAVDDRFKLLLGFRLSLVGRRQIQRQDGGYTNIGMSLLKLRRHLASKFATSDGVKDRLTNVLLDMSKKNLVAL